MANTLTDHNESFKKTQPYQKRLNQLYARTGIILLVVVFSILLLAYSVYQERLSQYLQIQAERQVHLLNTATGSFSRELGNLRNIILILNNSISELELSDKSGRLNKSRLAKHFVNFGQSVDGIRQIRWLDATGMEQVRVDFNNGGEPLVVAENRLQNKAGRYYFDEGIKTDAPAVYLSKIDLNQEFGAIEVPWQPMIRATYKTSSSQQRQGGLLVINFSLAKVFANVNKISADSLVLEILNKDGYWLLHPDADKQWGFQLNKPDFRLAIENPPLWNVLQSLSRKNSLLFGFASGKQLSSAALLTISESENVRTDDESLYFFVHTFGNMISASQWKIATPVILVSLALLAVLIWLVLRENFRHIQQIDSHFALAAEQKNLQKSYLALNEAYENLQLLQDELTENKKLAALGLCVAGVAHEINTPAGGIAIAADVLSDNIENLDQLNDREVDQEALKNFIEAQREGFDLIKIHTQKICDLVKRYKRLSIGFMDETPVEFCLSEVFKDAEYLLVPIAKKANVALQFLLPSDITLYSSPGIIAQVIQNLVNNAIAHGFTQQSQGCHICVQAYLLNKDSFVLDVTDNGSGIGEAMRDKLFDPFVTSQRGAGHSGLGLYMVHQWVVQVLKGSISILSEPGGGTTFHMTLPTSVTMVDAQKGAAA